MDDARRSLRALFDRSDVPVALGLALVALLVLAALEGPGAAFALFSFLVSTAAAVVGLYLLYRFVRAAERIADAQQRMAAHGDEFGTRRRDDRDGGPTADD